MKKINLPTKITISRIILAGLLLLTFFVLALLDEFNILVLANYNISVGGEATINYVMLILFFIFLIASFTDFLDGYIARKYNMVSDLGKFLDPIADKMLINGVMVFLAINFNSLNGFVKFPFFLVIIMIIRDLIVDALRFMAASKNVVIAANIYGKLKTVLQMFAICIVFLNGWPFNYFDYNFPTYLHISDIICYVATFVSVLSGIIYLKDNKNVFLGGNKDE